MLKEVRTLGDLRDEHVPVRGSGRKLEIQALVFAVRASFSPSPTLTITDRTIARKGMTNSPKCTIAPQSKAVTAMKMLRERYGGEDAIEFWNERHFVLLQIRAHVYTQDNDFHYVISEFRNLNEEPQRCLSLKKVFVARLSTLVKEVVSLFPEVRHTETDFKGFLKIVYKDAHTEKPDTEEPLQQFKKPRQESIARVPTSTAPLAVCSANPMFLPPPDDSQVVDTSDQPTQRDFSIDFSEEVIQSSGIGDVTTSTSSKSVRFTSVLPDKSATELEGSISNILSSQPQVAESPLVQVRSTNLQHVSDHSTEDVVVKKEDDDSQIDEVMSDEDLIDDSEEESDEDVHGQPNTKLSKIEAMVSREDTELDTPMTFSGYVIAIIPPNLPIVSCPLRGPMSTHPFKLVISDISAGLGTTYIPNKNCLELAFTQEAKILKFLDCNDVEVACESAASFRDVLKALQYSKRRVKFTIRRQKVASGTWFINVWECDSTLNDLVR